MIDPDTLALIASIVLAAAGLAVAAMARSRKSDDCRSRSSRDHVPEDVDSAKAEVTELMKHLELAGDRLEKKVDSRLGELRTAIEEAHQKAADLQAMLADLPAHMTKKPIRIGKAKSDEVLLLSDEGIDAVEIARKLNMDVGEVELLLSLRRSLRSSPAQQAEVRE